MKHRGSSKIKYEHHMIEGLREFLEKIESWDEIQSIVPGRINRRKGSGIFTFKVQYATSSGIKCNAKSGGAVQEVFLSTNSPETLIKKIQDKSSK